MSLPECLNPGEAVANKRANGDMVGVPSAVIPALGRPEFAELRTQMQPVPVEADDIGRWIAGQRRPDELVDRGKLLGRTPTEIWTRRPRQSVGSANSWASRSDEPRA